MFFGCGCSFKVCDINTFSSAFLHVVSNYLYADVLQQNSSSLQLIIKFSFNKCTLLYLWLLCSSFVQMFASQPGQLAVTNLYFPLRTTQAISLLPVATVMDGTWSLWRQLTFYSLPVKLKKEILKKKCKLINFPHPLNFQEMTLPMFSLFTQLTMIPVLKEPASFHQEYYFLTEQV